MTTFPRPAGLPEELQNIKDRLYALERRVQTYSDPETVRVNVQGAWSSSAPGPTDGTQFTCRPGVLRGICHASGYSTGGAPIRVDIYLDGVLQGTMRLEAALATNNHLALAAASFEEPVTAGTHYLYFRQTSGNSDTGDYGTFFGVVSDT